MGQLTTLSITDAVKDRLTEHRHREHETWSEAVEGLLLRSASIEDIREGCKQCGHEPMNLPPEQIGGVVCWSTSVRHGHTVYHCNYFCSVECAMAHQRER